MFERTILSVTVDGTLVFTHDDTGGPRPRVYSTTAGGFLNFFTNGGALKNLKIVNEKWMSDGTSNIAYVGGGEVAVGPSLNIQQVSNTSTIKANSNVVTEFPRSKKLIKYPRVALPSNQTSNPYTYGDYTIEVSSFYGDAASLAGSNAFDNIHNDYGWISGENTYNSSDGTAENATSPDTFQSIEGSWIGIQLPDKIRLEYITIKNRYSGAIRNADTGILWAKNTTDSTWYRVHDFSSLNTSSGAINTIYVNQRIAYDEYRLQITEMAAPYTSGGQPAVAIGEWELFGIPEYDPEAHGTDVVVKSVPNVPNTDWLEVYYEGKNYTSGNTVQDETENGIDGTFTGITYNTEYNSFDFSGVSSSSKITATLPSTFVGNQPLTVSVWFKRYNDSVNENTIWRIGPRTDEKCLGLAVSGGNFNFFGNDSTDGQFSSTTFNGGGYVVGRWYHVACVYDGSSRYIFIDSVRDGTTVTNSLDFNASTELVLGFNGVDKYLNGSIANFRLFNRALTSDEIWQLYAYQKEYFGHGDLGMTLKAGRLGIGTSEPRAALDVRGVINAETFYGLNDSTVAYRYFDTETTVYTFSNLNLKVGEAYKIIWHYHNTQTNHHVHMFVNGDETDTNYWHAIQQVTSSFAAAGSYGNTAKMFSTGGNSDHIWVYDLRLTWDRRPMMMGHGHFSTPTAGLSTGANQSWRLGTWNHNTQTDAITSLKFDPTSTGAFGAGSSIRILKMM
jgi:hypothetical protein